MAGPPGNPLSVDQEERRLLASDLDVGRHHVRSMTMPPPRQSRERRRSRSTHAIFLPPPLPRRSWPRSNSCVRAKGSDYLPACAAMAFRICSLTPSRLNDAPACIVGISTKVSPNFPTTCCTKTKRQNSYKYQSANSMEPVMPVRSNGSRRTLQRIGQSTLTVLPSHPPG